MTAAKYVQSVRDSHPPLESVTASPQMTEPRFKVVVTDQVFPSQAIESELLASIGAELQVADGTREGVVRLGLGADALLNTYLPVDAELISHLPRCRVIARYGIGVDNVDLVAARQAGIYVTNVPDYSVEEVAAHTLALILALVRRVAKADGLVRDGRWGIDGLRPIRRISHLTAGLLGYGRIARRVASALQFMGASIIVHDPYIEPSPDAPQLVSLDALLRRSDIVSIHAPLTPSTRGLVDARRLAQMRPGAVLVNTARGAIVDLDALLDVLRSGHLGGAGLDVFDAEPLDPARIGSVPNLLVTPHMAYYSEEALEESQRKAATQVIKVLSGAEPDYPVAKPEQPRVAT